MLRILFFIVLAAITFRLLMWAAEKKLLYYPTAQWQETPEAYGIPFADLEFHSGMNILSGWYVDAGSSVTILYCHGNAGNIGDRVDKLHRFYLMGLNVFIFDYRGYGHSSGQPSETGMYQDVTAAFDHMQAAGLIRSEGSVVAYGTSLGGAVASYLATVRPVGGLILENSFYSLREIAGSLYPAIPSVFVPDTFRTCDYIVDAKVPKLIFHAADDEIVPYSHGVKLSEAAAGNVSFYRTEGGHNESYIESFDLWKREILKFISTEYQDGPQS